MGIDLLEHILAQLDEPVSVSYYIDPDIPTHLTSIREGRVDFGIAATTITSERLGSFEFSHPFYLADLGIIAEKEPTPDLLSQIFTRNVVFGIILVIVCMIIAGHIIWLIEREEDGHFHTSYLRGVATGVWWTIRHDVDGRATATYIPKNLWARRLRPLLSSSASPYLVSRLRRSAAR